MVAWTVSSRHFSLCGASVLGPAIASWSRNAIIRIFYAAASSTSGTLPAHSALCIPKRDGRGTDKSDVRRQIYRDVTLRPTSRNRLEYENLEPSVVIIGAANGLLRVHFYREPPKKRPPSASTGQAGRRFRKRMPRVWPESATGPRLRTSRNHRHNQMNRESRPIPPFSSTQSISPRIHERLARLKRANSFHQSVVR